jgi:hypothetical protein
MKPLTIIDGLLLGEAAAHQVEELLLADLRDRRLVADRRRRLLDLDVRVGVGARCSSRISASQTTFDFEP